MAVTRPLALLMLVGSIVLIFAILQIGGSDWSATNLAHAVSSSASKNTPKPRYIFVDLGANSADSLDVFLKRENAKFDYDFPRPDWATYEEAEIYLFEANPHFNTALVEAKEHYDALGIKVNIFPSTVVDVEDGTRTFYLDTHWGNKDFWGSSVIATHPDVVASKSNGTDLTAINISRWLLMNTLTRDFVVVKMDIEGAEYDVVPHMVLMSVWTVVDYLLVEWHGHVLPQEPTDPPGQTNAKVARVQEAQRKLEAEGVQMPVYDSPA